MHYRNILQKFLIVILTAGMVLGPITPNLTIKHETVQAATDTGIGGCNDSSATAKAARALSAATKFLKPKWKATPSSMASVAVGPGQNVSPAVNIRNDGKYIWTPNTVKLVQNFNGFAPKNYTSTTIAMIEPGCHQVDYGEVAQFQLKVNIPKTNPPVAGYTYKLCYQLKYLPDGTVITANDLCWNITVKALPVKHKISSAPPSQTNSPNTSQAINNPDPSLAAADKAKNTQFRTNLEKYVITQGLKNHNRDPKKGTKIKCPTSNPGCVLIPQVNQGMILNTLVDDGFYGFNDAGQQRYLKAKMKKSPYMLVVYNSLALSKEAKEKGIWTDAGLIKAPHVASPGSADQEKQLIQLAQKAAQDWLKFYADAEEKCNVRSSAPDPSINPLENKDSLDYYGLNKELSLHSVKDGEKVFKTKSCWNREDLNTLYKKYWPDYVPTGDGGLGKAMYINAFSSRELDRINRILRNPTMGYIFIRYDARDLDKIDNISYYFTTGNVIYGAVLLGPLLLPVDALVAGIVSKIGGSILAKVGSEAAVELLSKPLSYFLLQGTNKVLFSVAGTKIDGYIFTTLADGSKIVVAGVTREQENIGTQSLFMLGRNKAGQYGYKKLTNQYIIKNVEVKTVEGKLLSMAVEPLNAPGTISKFQLTKVGQKGNDIIATRAGESDSIYILEKSSQGKHGYILNKSNQSIAASSPATKQGPVKNVVSGFISKVVGTKISGLELKDLTLGEVWDPTFLGNAQPGDINYVGETFIFHSKTLGEDLNIVPGRYFKYSGISTVNTKKMIKSLQMADDGLYARLHNPYSEALRIDKADAKAMFTSSRYVTQKVHDHVIKIKGASGSCIPDGYCKDVITGVKSGPILISTNYRSIFKKVNAETTTHEAMHFTNNIKGVTASERGKTALLEGCTEYFSSVEMKMKPGSYILSVKVCLELEKRLTILTGSNDQARELLSEAYLDEFKPLDEYFGYRFYEDLQAKMRVENYNGAIAMVRSAQFMTDQVMRSAQFMTDQVITQQIAQAIDFNELYIALRNFGSRPIQGSKKSYTVDEIRGLIGEVRFEEPGYNINEITRNYGIKAKVEQLMAQQAKYK